MLPLAGLNRTLLLLAAVSLASVPCPVFAQAGNATPGGPSSPKAQKLFSEAVELQQHSQERMAIDAYRKANKQDGGRCFDCMRRAHELAMSIGFYKDARSAVEEGMAGAQNDADRAMMHFWMGMAWQREGVQEKKDKYFVASCSEFKTSLALEPSFTATRFSYGVSLAYLHRDDDARAQFNAFLTQDKELPALHPRAQRFAERVDLARARMAPAFSITTIDGQRISLDSLTGKVVLIDFWATWCGPCVEAMPHLVKIAQQFQGQQFVALSVSIDEDAAAWKKFISANHMTWPQYRDGVSDTSIAALFGVHQVPATFSIDADGILEDQQLSDVHIEVKLKKLIAQAAETQNRGTQTASTPHP